MTVTLGRFILDQLEEGATDDAFPLKPQRILCDLRTRMGREDILKARAECGEHWSTPSACTRTHR